MGQDNYENLSSWKEHEFIKDNFEIIVYPREKENNKYEFSEIFNVSSSEIRNKIRNNLSISGLVPENVESDILLNKYYTK